mgnify:CR=1 FL=1
MATPPPLGSRTDFILTCPNDGEQMEKVQAGNFLIDRCTHCGALWFDMAELQRMIAHTMPMAAFETFAKEEKRGPTIKVKKCPRDHTPLTDVPDAEQPQIIFQQCSECGGLLLNAGQLLDLTQYTLAERVKTFFRL